MAQAHLATPPPHLVGTPGPPPQAQGSGLGSLVRAVTGAVSGSVSTIARGNLLSASGGGGAPGAPGRGRVSGELGPASPPAGGGAAAAADGVVASSGVCREWVLRDGQEFLEMLNFGERGGRRQ